MSTCLLCRLHGLCHGASSHSRSLHLGSCTAGAYLAACPVVRPRHAAVGLLLAGLAHAGAAAGGRFTPEALNFVTDLLADAAQGVTADSVLRLQPLTAADNRTGGAERSEPQPLRLSAVLGPSQDDAQFSSPVLLPFSTYFTASSQLVCCLPPRACHGMTAYVSLIPSLNP